MPSSQRSKMSNSVKSRSPPRTQLDVVLHKDDEMDKKLEQIMQKRIAIVAKIKSWQKDMKNLSKNQNLCSRQVFDLQHKIANMVDYMHRDIDHCEKRINDLKTQVDKDYPDKVEKLCQMLPIMKDAYNELKVCLEDIKTLADLMDTRKYRVNQREDLVEGPRLPDDDTVDKVDMIRNWLEQSARPSSNTRQLFDNAFGANDVHRIARGNFVIDRRRDRRDARDRRDQRDRSEHRDRGDQRDRRDARDRRDQRDRSEHRDRGDQRGRRDQRDRSEQRDRGDQRDRRDQRDGSEQRDRGDQRDRRDQRDGSEQRDRGDQRDRRSQRDWRN